MLFSRLLIAILTALASSSLVYSEPPTDPEARKAYDHAYKWLEKQHVGFIAANMRGSNDQQYRERRQAAFDLLREKKDLTTVPEMLDELDRKSFLSGDICEALGEWKVKKAMPVLKQVSADPKRPKDVRAKAAKALWLIKSAPKEAPPPTY